MENSSGRRDDSPVKAVQKRYEGLVSVRTKAIRGKGAWYWTHLEPILVRAPETGLPKAVKLRCGLCNSVFSASNPSRTASEHLKRGTCPNFTGSVAKPLSSSATAVIAATPLSRKRDRNQPQPLSFVESSPQLAVLYQPAMSTTAAASTVPVALSGGKEDLGPLAMLEDSVKKLKSPKASTGPALTKTQVEFAVGLLVDWLFESCGTVSFSGVDHAKFKSFLEQVGLPPIDRRELVGAKLDARFQEVRAESEARLREAMFFQLASDGWSKKNSEVVSIAVNLPNGTSLFQNAIFTDNVVTADYAERVLWEAITTAGPQERCVGIVADRFKAKALRKLESRNPWMVNLCCQLKAFGSLVKDFGRQLPLFTSVTESCLKLLNFFHSNSQARSLFHKYQLQQSHDHSTLLPLLRPAAGGGKDVDPLGVYEMLQDVANSMHVLQMVVGADSYKSICQDDPLAREIAEMMDNVGFLSELEAALSLVRILKSMADDIESDRPLVGQCLPLWEELRIKTKEWCLKYNVQEEILVGKVIDRRFQKNYHPAWSTAYVLDPLYLQRDAAGRYLPPFQRLSPDQERDVDKLITRLVSREEAPIALHELMKWRSEGLDPLYAQAVQVKERDPVTGKMKVANPPSRRLVWDTCLGELGSLRKVAVRLIFLHATSSSFKWKNTSLLRWVAPHGRPGEAMDKAQKMLFIAANAKMERRDFSSEEEKDTELFSISNGGEDDVLNEVLLDSSV